MKLVAKCKLVVTPDDKARLLATMVMVNRACNWLAELAFQAKCADAQELQRRYYKLMRQVHGLSAQHTLLAIRKVCEAYKRDRSIRPSFRPHGAIAFDSRVYTFTHSEHVSLTVLDGRVVVPVIADDYHRARLEGKRGQADLIYRKGKFFLHVSCTVEQAKEIAPAEWLGVDMGVVNLAYTSDAEKFSGAQVEKVRARYHGLRQRLQKVGTRSARKRLKKIGGKEARFRAITNHQISKSIVASAQGTGRGIAMEDLHGINDRVTVRHKQKAQRMGWAFFQLRSFVSYKACVAGVPVRVVDPRNTSRTCLACGHCDKRNRKSQSEFRCVLCRFEAHADLVGATNISRRAAVNQPTVPGIRRETVTKRIPRLAQGQSLGL